MIALTIPSSTRSRAGTAAATPPLMSGGSVAVSIVYRNTFFRLKTFTMFRYGFSRRPTDFEPTLGAQVQRQ